MYYILVFILSHYTAAQCIHTVCFSKPSVIWVGLFLSVWEWCHSESVGRKLLTGFRHQFFIFNMNKMARYTVPRGPLSHNRPMLGVIFLSCPCQKRASCCRIEKQPWSTPIKKKKGKYYHYHRYHHVKMVVQILEISLRIAMCMLSSFPKAISLFFLNSLC